MDFDKKTLKKKLFVTQQQAHTHTHHMKKDNRQKPEIDKALTTCFLPTDGKKPKPRLAKKNASKTFHHTAVVVAVTALGTHHMNVYTHMYTETANKTENVQ